MSLSDLSIRRPVATLLLTAGVALAGVAAFFLLPVSPLPQVDFPTISVSAALPGASPETMATSVATPLERRLGLISDVTEMTSSSRTGQTQITLQFGLTRKIEGAARDVQAAINAARVDLPATLRTNPTYRKMNPADAPILILAMTSATRTPGQIYDVAATTIQQRLLQARGVGDVTLGGGSLPAVRVELNPQALARFGISLEDVRAALASANANRPKGVIESGPQRLQIYTNDTGVRAADYAPLIIAARNGAIVRLSDVGQVSDAVEDSHTLGLFNGRPAIIVVISRQPGANIIGVVDRVKAMLPQLRAALPADIDMQVAVDRTISIRASLAEVERTVLIAVFLVIAVVAFFLRAGRAMWVPTVAVSISLLGALALMLLFGFSLDNLSLMALTVSTGFVVDDAIVVLENITRHVEAGVDPFEAALKGAREVSFTVFSISISLIAVFIPILLMGGIIGRLFREFALTLSAAVMVSLAVSLTTTPMMCAWLLDHRRAERPAGRLTRWAERSVSAMRQAYERALDWALDAAPVMIALLIAAIGLSIYCYAVAPKGFLPEQDSGQMMGGLRSDQASSFQITERRLRRFVAILVADPSVQNVVAFAGGRGGAGGGFLVTTLKPRGERKGGAQAAIARLRPKLSRIAGASLFLNPAQDLRVGGRQANAAYQYTLEGQDLAELRRWSGRLAQALRASGEVTDVSTDQEDRGLETYVTIDPDAAARLGVTNRALDNTLYDAFGQRQVSTIFREENQYHVVMEVDPAFSQNPAALQDIYVSTGQPAVAAPATPNGGPPAAGVSGPAAPPARGASTGVAVSATPERMVPLSALGHWADQAAPTSVAHQDTQPATTLSFNLPPGRSLGQATAAIERAQAAIGMPTSIHGGFQGTAKVFQSSLASEPLLILAALVAIYLVLGILYESTLHPLTVLSTLPSAGLGAVIALIVCRIDFSIISLIGVILLIGIVKKNAILMIDFALAAEREQGLGPREAIRQAALARFRPIMMTTFAAILGALPLAIGWGEGAELRRPLGVAIIGGLLVSQAVTLLTTPAIFLTLDRFRRPAAAVAPAQEAPA